MNFQPPHWIQTNPRIAVKLETMWYLSDAAGKNEKIHNTDTEALHLPCRLLQNPLEFCQRAFVVVFTPHTPPFAGEGVVVNFFDQIGRVPGGHFTENSGGGSDQLLCQSPELLQSLALRGVRKPCKTYQQYSTNAKSPASFFPQLWLVQLQLGHLRIGQGGWVLHHWLVLWCSINSIQPRGQGDGTQPIPME